MTVLAQIHQLQLKGNKGIAYLLDPDKINEATLPDLLLRFGDSPPDLLLVGGSLLTETRFNAKLKLLRELTDLPLVLFPSSPMQLTPEVDAVFFLSLISGRNPELLIGHHVNAAPRVRELGIEAMATGYMLIDGGMPTTASYMSNTQPIPRDKADIAAATALAGEMLGLSVIYLDAGSGAPLAVPIETISAVRKNISLPLIVGGGIRNREQITAAFNAGADLVVIGTAIEEDPELIAGFRAIRNNA